MTIDYFPPPMRLELAEPEDTVQANLMPFHIDYSGPAPVESFMVLRPAPAEPDANDQEPAESFISAFRGRAIQSTQLPLPPGYVGKAVHVPAELVAAEPSSVVRGEASGSTPPPTKKLKTELKKKAFPPRSKAAKMQKFSMDSDEEDDDAEEQKSRLAAEQAAEEAEEEDAEESNDAEAVGTSEKSQMLRPIANLAGNAIRVWGADGPIDSGDDIYHRTLQEWITVVAPELHSH